MTSTNPLVTQGGPATASHLGRYPTFIQKHPLGRVDMAIPHPVLHAAVNRLTGLIADTAPPAPFFPVRGSCHRICFAYSRLTSKHSNNCCKPSLPRSQATRILRRRSSESRYRCRVAGELAIARVITNRIQVYIFIRGGSGRLWKAEPRQLRVRSEKPIPKQQAVPMIRNIASSHVTAMAFNSLAAGISFVGATTARRKVQPSGTARNISNTGDSRRRSPRV